MLGQSANVIQIAKATNISPGEAALAMWEAA
jgi:hypothetical protein